MNTTNEQERTAQQPLVWYASYGSNMNLGRFMCYITGGTPEGGNIANVGCTDSTPPLDSIPIELPYSLYFAGDSMTWEGAVAFLRLTRHDDTTKGRAYLITKNQFEEVSAQESRVDTISPVNIDQLRKQGHMPTGAGNNRYDEFIYCGEYANYPIVSFTSSAELTPHMKPSPAYLKMIGTGLIAAHNMTAHEVAVYLSSKPGILGNYAVGDLVEYVSH